MADEKFENEFFHAMSKTLIWHSRERFKRAAKVMAWGREDSDNAMQMAGAKAVRRIAMELDTISPRFREGILSPLLKHRDPSIRIAAAASLALRAPHKAIPVLEHISDHDRDPAHRLNAGQILMLHRFGDLGWLAGERLPEQSKR